MYAIRSYYGHGYLPPAFRGFLCLRGGFLEGAKLKTTFCSSRGSSTTDFSRTSVPTTAVMSYNFV